MSHKHARTNTPIFLSFCLPLSPHHTHTHTHTCNICYVCELWAFWRMKKACFGFHCGVFAADRGRTHEFLAPLNWQEESRMKLWSGIDSELSSWLLMKKQQEAGTNSEAKVAWGNVNCGLPTFFSVPKTLGKLGTPHDQIWGLYIKRVRFIEASGLIPSRTVLTTYFHFTESSEDNSFPKRASATLEPCSTGCFASLDLLSASFMNNHDWHLSSAQERVGDGSKCGELIIFCAIATQFHPSIRIFSIFSMFRYCQLTIWMSHQVNYLITFLGSYIY